MKHIIKLYFIITVVNQCLCFHSHAVRPTQVIKTGIPVVQ